MSFKITPIPKGREIWLPVAVIFFINVPLESIVTQYNKPRPATPSFIMMIATNTGSRPSNQLAILQQALKERVKKCVLLQNPCSTSYGRQITFKDFYMMWWKGQQHFVVCTTNAFTIHIYCQKQWKFHFIAKKIPLKQLTLWEPKLGRFQAKK